MKDWASSLTILSAAFVGTVVVTVGLAAVLVPQAFRTNPRASPAASGVATVDATPPPVDVVPSAIGGTLTVTGDVEGTLVLDREEAAIGFEFDGEVGIARLEDGPYRLSGDDGRITFGLHPPVVDQIDYAGRSFYPEPDECDITPGVLNPALGIATAGLRCEDIADVRDNGVVTIDGTVMAAGDVLGMRGELPPSGGTVSIGPATVVLSEARALLDAFAIDAATGLASLPMLDAEADSGVILDYNPETHQLDIGSIIVNGESAEPADGACRVTRTDIGLLNPRTSVVELSVECDALDVPGVGRFPAAGSLVVDLIGVDQAP